ncbi:hypothetical protein HY624_04280 [Candidatus Uhrbacteria bacterium]|nr:hypothetical protein [Candidatus Uhrbacteria bacterium]
MSDQPSSSSILDKILTERQQEAFGQFQPSIVVHELLQHCSEKERTVLVRRFGLEGTDESETLESIGKLLSLTRERVRQIERGAITKLSGISPIPPLLAHADRVLDDVLRASGGALEREQLIETVLTTSLHKSHKERASLVFLLDQIFTRRFLAIEDGERFFPGWRLPSLSLSTLDALMDAALVIIDATGKPMTEEQLFTALHTSPWCATAGADCTDPMIVQLFRLSKEIRPNAFGAWGRSSWSTIAPRRMNDKIALVLEAAGKPLHFTEIAKKINDAKFDHKTAYPATVHNELIADERFVLVGRGLYALKSWGYRPGVVADIIAHVLTDAARPLSRDEVVREVLKQRVVSESTIYLSLLQKERFERTADGKYILRAVVAPPVASPPVAAPTPETTVTSS